MTNNNHFSPASEKGHFNGLVDEGKYLRQSSLYKQILPRTPSRLKTCLPHEIAQRYLFGVISVNPVILSDIFRVLRVLRVLRGEKICLPREIVKRYLTGVKISVICAICV